MVFGDGPPSGLARDDPGVERFGQLPQRRRRVGPDDPAARPDEGTLHCDEFLDDGLRPFPIRDAQRAPRPHQLGTLDGLGLEIDGNLHADGSGGRLERLGNRGSNDSDRLGGLSYAECLFAQGFQHRQLTLELMDVAPA